MLKLVYCIAKKPGLTDAEFFDYWKNIHGPIGARIPRLRRLAQSYRRTVPGDAHPPDYDGMAELGLTRSRISSPPGNPRNGRRRVTTRRISSTTTRSRILSRKRA